MHIMQRTTAILRCGALAVALCAAAHHAARADAATGALPQPDSVVIVIEENKDYSQIIGSDEAPYINALARQGALFTRSFGLLHPSQPNYLALFSGSTQGVADDSCPHAFSGDNLGATLLQAGKSFAVYAESLPSVGFAGCEHRNYARKHNPAPNWQGANLPASANLPFYRFNPQQLPTVSIVVPNQKNDMHSGSIRRGDDWLRVNIDPYVQWAKTHNSLLILTWDEGSKKGDNRIPTIFVGPMVKPGLYDQRIDHYSVLGTITDLYRLPRIGNSAASAPIHEIWTKAPAGEPSLTGTLETTGATPASR